MLDADAGAPERRARDGHPPPAAPASPRPRRIERWPPSSSSTTSPRSASRSSARSRSRATRSSSPPTARRPSTRLAGGARRRDRARRRDAGHRRPRGLPAAARARATARPVLMLTARDAVADRVDGLDAGADDYLVKPFALAELHGAPARAAAPHGRARRVAGSRFADLTLDPADPRGAPRRARGRAHPHRVRAARAADRAPAPGADPVADLRARSGATTSATSSNSLGVYIGYLRRKTEAGGEPRLIQTVRGVGYALRE